MNLFFKPVASKELKKLPVVEARKIFKKIQLLKEFPFSGKPLNGEFEGSRSVRAWPYRVIYRIQPKIGIVIETIKHRQSSYKK